MNINPNVTRVIHAKVVDPGARAQMDLIVNSPALTGLCAGMPDIHEGAGCVIGFTGRFGDAVIPNIVGVDIGCGVRAHRLSLPLSAINLQKLDEEIRARVPLGTRSHPQGGSRAMLNRLSPADRERAREVCARAEEFYHKARLTKVTPPLEQEGTMGGGNHFAELVVTGDGTVWAVVHSGSRNFGKQVADHFQIMAKEWCRAHKVSVPQGMEHLPLDAGGSDYMKWMGVAQDYAVMNRKALLAAILEPLGVRYEERECVESVHNYIGSDGIIRKGAISAYAGEKVLIPLNMGEGVILGCGKGNPDFNFSAPHGAGRRYGRGQMRARLASGEVSMDEFRERMKSVYSTSISERTIDESPMAYKSFDDIKDDLLETVEIGEIARPVYNLKAEELSRSEQKALKKLARERAAMGLDVEDLDLSEGDLPR
jgi:tRNA-splicing ligase RtcB